MSFINEQKYYRRESDYDKSSLFLIRCYQRQLANQKVWTKWVLKEKNT